MAAVARGFGGKARREKNEQTKQTLADQHKEMLAAMSKLEEAEMKMWRMRHDGALDKDALFKEIEKANRSMSATAEDRKNLVDLTKLREKRDHVEAFRSRFLNSSEWKTAPLPPARVVDFAPQSSLDHSRFWAVVVGINVYIRTLNNLEGACPDAISIYEYLTADLKVPHDHIRLLLSEEPKSSYSSLDATRDNILSALYDHLRDNTNVRKGDNILFYFAGHGTSYKASTLFEHTSDTIEALCPSDRGCDSRQGTVPDISDREISLFLVELERSKGANITVILDCCHSGGAVREIALEHVRAGPPLPNLDEMLRAADEDGRRQKGPRIARTEDWDWNTDHCVLLASCQSHEYAKEAEFEGTWHGYFTRALLAMLKRKQDKTYLQLCEAVTQHMPTYKGMYVQSPQLIGKRQDCRIWFVEAGEGAEYGQYQHQQEAEIEEGGASERGPEQEDEQEKDEEHKHEQENDEDEDEDEDEDYSDDDLDAEKKDGGHGCYIV